jgi:hypothetical protein
MTTSKKVSGDGRAAAGVRAPENAVSASADGPGGWFWLMPIAVGGWWLLRLMRSRDRSRRDDRACA